MEDFKLFILLIIIQIIIKFSGVLVITFQSKSCYIGQKMNLNLAVIFTIITNIILFLLVQYILIKLDYQRIESIKIAVIIFTICCIIGIISWELWSHIFVQEKFGCNIEMDIFSFLSTVVASVMYVIVKYKADEDQDIPEKITVSEFIVALQDDQNWLKDFLHDDINKKYPKNDFDTFLQNNSFGQIINALEGITNQESLIPVIGVMIFQLNDNHDHIKLLLEASRDPKITKNTLDKINDRGLYNIFASFDGYDKRGNVWIKYEIFTGNIDQFDPTAQDLEKPDSSRRIAQFKLQK